MPLRTRLLLSLVLIALIPLLLFGFTAYQAATTSLNAVERDNLEGALDSVDRALDTIQHTLENNVRDNSNWDEIHDRVAKDPVDQDWFNANFSPDIPTSTVNTFSLNAFGIWRGADRLLFQVGPVQELARQLGDRLLKALTLGKPHTLLMTFGPDIYLISFSAIRDSAGNDPNGLLLMGRKLGPDDLNQIKALTAYDVAFYKGEQPIASVQAQALTPSPADLQSAAQGKMVFNQLDPNIALAYKPLQDEDGNALATMVVWRSRRAVTAAQASISSTLVIWFVVAAVFATVVAFFLGRSIAYPLLAMADRATKMAAGDLSQRMVAPYRAKDAVVQLVDAFNEMAARVGMRISDSVRENERLVAIDEYRLNLLTAIAQALRTPLNNIHSHSDSLDMALYGSLNDAQRRSVAVIRRAVGIAEALLTDLVDFARAQQGQLQIARSRLLLVDIVLNVSDAVRQRYAGKHIQLALSIPEDLPPLFADRVRVEQIMDNLLGWAYDFTPEGGQVRLAANAQRGEIAVSISDTSDGLTAEEQSRLFDLFYHPSRPYQRDGQSTPSGNGLGLALVKALVEQQSGEIRVDVQPGRGNTFTFTLPTTN